MKLLYAFLALLAYELRDELGLWLVSTFRALSALVEALQGR